jgi:hypothetical protein
VNCVYDTLTTALQDVSGLLLICHCPNVTPQYAIGIENSGIPPPTKRDLSDFPATLHADVEALVAAARAKA